MLDAGLILSGDATIVINERFAPPYYDDPLNKTGTGLVLCNKTG